MPNDPDSSNGRTSDSESLNGGSTPSSGTDLPRLEWIGVPYLTTDAYGLTIQNKDYLFSADHRIGPFEMTLLWGAEEDRRALLHLGQGGSLKITVEFVP